MRIPEPFFGVFTAEAELLHHHGSFHGFCLRQQLGGAS